MILAAVLVTGMGGGIYFLKYRTLAVKTAALQAAREQPTALGTKKKVRVFPAVGYRAPNFSLRTLHGKTVSLKSLRGKPVYINFWATWCTYCKAEAPAIEKLQEQYGKKLVILGVDLMYSEKSVKAVARFVKQEKETYTILLDTTGAIANQYLVRAAPESVFVNPQGLVTTFYVGQMSYNEMVKAYQLAK